MKILLSKRRSLGDTVLMTSTVQAVHEAFPEAEIYALLPEAYEGLLKVCPGLKDIWHFEEGLFPLVQKIRGQKFDYFLNLHSSPGNRWLGYLSGARKVRHHYQNSVTEKAYGKHPNALEWDHFFLEKIFSRKFNLPPTKIYLSPEEIKEGEEYWRHMGLEGKNIVILGIGASRPTKRWPAEYFAKLGELLADQSQLVPVILMGPGEEEALFAGSIVDHFRALGMRPKGARLDKGDFLQVGGLSIRQMAKIFHAAKYYVGNDSGPKHLAVAAGIPTFTFFGPEDPTEWHPYSREIHPLFFIPELKCRNEDNGRWCSIPLCNVEAHRCMTGLRPIDIFQEIRNYGAQA